LNGYTEIYPRYLSDKGTRRLVPLIGGIAVTTKFFDDYYEGKSFDDTLIYLGACHGAASRDFFDVLEKYGVKTLLAYEHAVYWKYDRQMFYGVFSHLVSYSFPDVQTAVTVAKAAFGTQDPYNNLLQWQTCDASYSGGERLEP